MNKLPLVFSLIFTDIKTKNKIILNSCATVGVSGSIVCFQAIVGHFLDKYVVLNAEIILTTVLITYGTVFVLTYSLSTKEIN